MPAGSPSGDGSAFSGTRGRVGPTRCIRLADPCFRARRSAPRPGAPGQTPRSDRSPALPSLRRSHDSEPGYRRLRRGRGFRYVDDRGRAVSLRVRKRITALAIPPAWREVWICRSARGHVQATGVDAAGRKQYLYHPRWHEERDAEKYERILGFAERLPGLRRRVRDDLRHPRLDRERALAAVVRILDRTHLRVGGEEYARDYGTYGLATLRSRHLEVVGDRVILDFEGKGGVDQHAEVEDPALARAVAQMDEMPGHEDFAYRDEGGEIVDVRSEDINAYIKAHLNDEFSAKDFRTWSATVAAAVALDELEPVDGVTAKRRAIAGVCRTVADLLGNTPAVCRSSYIDPRVIAHYEDGVTLSALRSRLERASARDLSVRERAVLALLRRRLQG